MSGPGPLQSAFYQRAREEREQRITVWRWSVWMVCLAVGMFLFYVLLTPLWLGLRAAAWAAELRARRRNR